MATIEIPAPAAPVGGGGGGELISRLGPGLASTTSASWQYTDGPAAFGGGLTIPTDGTWLLLTEGELNGTVASSVGAIGFAINDLPPDDGSLATNQRDRTFYLPSGGVKYTAGLVTAVEPLLAGDRIDVKMRKVSGAGSVFYVGRRVTAIRVA